jgi:exopolysaccharide biosynthesis polyprenyl glycosylphosphotransferase
MSTSVELNKAAHLSVEEALAADLHLVQSGERRTTATRFRRLIVVGEVTADLLTIMLAVIMGYVIYESFAVGKHIYYPLGAVLAVALVFAIVVVLMLDRVGAYRMGNSLLRVRETEQVLRVSAEAFLLVFAVSFFTNVLFSRWLLVLCFAFVPLLLFAQKSLTYAIIRNLHSRGYGNEKVLIYGSGCTGRRVFSVLKRSPKLGLDAVAFVDDDPGKAGSTVYEMAYERRRSAPVVKGPVTGELVANYGADLVIIAIPSIAHADFIRTVQEALNANARVSFVPSHLLASDPWIDYQDIDGVLLASFGKPTRRLGYEALKRISDLAVTLTIMALGSPLFFLLALIIKLDSRGPVMFKQERVGQNGRIFRMYKFRTMYANASPYEYSPRSGDDPRITRVGKFLRRTSFDELPQLLNVLRGDMSLVGPRPEMPFIVQQYKERHRQRLQVKPGLTGLWQLSGDRAFLIHDNIEYDLYYIQHRNLFMDVAILLHTSFFAMRGV